MSLCVESSGCMFGRFKGVVEMHRFYPVDTVEYLTRCFREAYTGLPVVRVIENQKAVNCVALNYSIPVYEE